MSLNYKNLENTRPFIILLVEDNPDDILLTQNALKGSKFIHKLYVAKDGKETMAFLNKNGEFKTAPSPDIILLDLNLPKMSGYEILVEIKNNPNLKHIPIVVLTVSDAEKDILKSYELHANCFITKPIDFKEFIENLKTIKDFWLSIVKLPRGNMDG